MGLDAGTLAQEKRRVLAAHAQKRGEQCRAQGGLRRCHETQSVGGGLRVSAPELGGWMRAAALDETELYRGFWCTACLN